MRRLDAPKALAIGGAIVLAANAVILGQASWSRSGAPTATLELTERELAMPLTREKDDTGLELTLVTTDRLPEAVKLAALWRRIELPAFELPWLDAAKLRELGFDPDAVAGDPADRRRVLPRIAFVVLENDGPAWEAWLAESGARGSKTEALVAIDRTARSRLMPVDAGLDPKRLRETYPDATRYAVVPASIDLAEAKAGDEKAIPRGTIVRLDAGAVHVPIEILPQLEPFIPRLDEEENVRRLRDPKETGLPAPEGPRYRATVAFGRDGRPWLVGVRPMGAGAPDS